MARTMAALWVTLALMLSACGGSDEPASAGEASPPADEPAASPLTDSTSSTSSPESEPASTTSTTADPFAIYQPTEPFEITVAWDCSELIDRGGSFASACSIRQADHPILDAANWNSTITYRTDEDGNKVGIAVGTNSYGPACNWTNEAGIAEADLIDGFATYSGVLIGDGRCDGIQWVFETTWDDEAHTHVTSGVIGPIP